MQKTKIGISAGCFGAVIYLAGVTGGLLLAAILIGYVLLVEENLWLRRCAVKAGALLFVFSMCILAIGLIPDAINCIESFLSVIRINANEVFITNLTSAIVQAVQIWQKILFLALGLKALNMSTIVMPGVEKFVDQCMNMNDKI